MSDNEFNLNKLSSKFPEEDIEWRVQQCGMSKNGNPWAMIIPYITNRAIMQRLDESVGMGRWQNEYKLSPCGKGYMCGISIKIEGEWVTRWDGSEISSSGNIDDVKSTASSSMKRTGVQWGIGRYLYQFDAQFADCKPCSYQSECQDGYNFQYSKDKNTGQKFGFQWKPKPLESWALPITEAEKNFHFNQMGSAQTLEQLKNCYMNAYKLATSENDKKLLEKYTKAKDEAKQRIAVYSEEQKQRDDSNLMKLVSFHIEKLNAAINESAVNGLADLGITEIGNMSSGKQYTDACTLIKKAVKTKILQLRGEQNGN